MASWAAEPVEEHTQIRDLALLKLFFGELVPSAQVAALAVTRADAHRERLAVYEQIDAVLRPAGVAARHEHATVRLGLAYERAAVQFWADIAAEWEPAAPVDRGEVAEPS